MRHEAEVRCRVGIAEGDDAGMEMQSASGLALSDLRSECDVKAVLPCQGAENPLGHHELVSCRLDGRYEELYLVLLVHLAVQSEVADLGVGVLDVAALTGSSCHRRR